jgi:tetratricopeptide (TPR) repeat protein
MRLNRLPRVTTKNHALQPGRQAPADPIGIPGTILMTSILRCTLAALAFASTVWLAATPAMADDFESCAKASGDEAMAACTRAINSGRYDGRELAVLFKGRCVEWIKKQEIDKAIEDCSQAIRLKHDFARAFSDRGGAYLFKEQYDRAIEDYDQAIRLDPDDANAFNNRGSVYSLKGQYDRGIEDYNQAIRLNPDDIIAFTNRGRAYQLKGQYDRSIEDFDQAIRLCPDYARAFYNRALSWERKSGLQRALADFKKFAELNPSDSDGPTAVERVTKALNGR